MHPNKQINKKSPLNHTDFIDIIKDFETTGIIIDDSGRNKIKTFKVKEHLINVKSFKVPNLINKVIYKYFRKSKAQRSYEYANLLLSKGILTPKPIAYYEYATILSLQNSYYFSEHLNYNLTYRELINNSDYPDRKKILIQFTRFTFKLHELGIYFKDHSPGNTLIVKNEEEYDFYLIDLNRMAFYELDFQDRMKNFSRLTHKKEMIKIMSTEYAKLIEQPFQKVYDSMRHETEVFFNKQNRKKQLKDKFLGKKNKSLFH